MSSESFAWPTMARAAASPAACRFRFEDVTRMQCDVSLLLMPASAQQWASGFVRTLAEGDGTRTPSGALVDPEGSDVGSPDGHTVK